LVKLLQMTGAALAIPAAAVGTFVPLSTLDFQKWPAHPDFKKSAKARRCG
jgi:hypothetical protein